MRLPFYNCRLSATPRRSLPACPRTTIASIILTLASTPSYALELSLAPAANLDLTSLGRIGIVGDFDGISLHQFETQTEVQLSANNTESLLAFLPNGALGPVATTDASINAMCFFRMSHNKTVGVVLGGNFTSLDGTPSQGIALFDPFTSQITPLTGLYGQVHAVLCDTDSDTVYVGGNFIGPNATNAVAWYGTEGWTTLPFHGLNGPVHSITKASNGHIIFGGSFTGIGNASTPLTPDSQTINLSTANITTSLTGFTQGFNDPYSIACHSGAHSWILQDNSSGYWQADLAFGFEPTKLRLWNTHLGGRGTKTWRFKAQPLDGILNFTYTDPATGTVESCTSQCPLSQDTEVKFQDFHFVNVVGMNSFRIDISDYYGAGGGLDGVALFADDIFAYAINDFNEPSCSGIEFPSAANAMGPWFQTPSPDGDSPYLTVPLLVDSAENSVFVAFFPDLRQSGFYSVNMYTPGCIQDDTCAYRGQVNITGFFKAATLMGEKDFSTSVYQTNNFDKYDQIYFGFIDGASATFRPHLTLKPLDSQSMTHMTMVAQRVGFTLINSTGGLNGLFDYDPTVPTITTASIQVSAVNRLGGSFVGDSAVFALASEGNMMYIAGNFTSTTAENIIAIDIQDGVIAHLDGGLNGPVNDMQLTGSVLFAGGKFSDTLTGHVAGLSNVAFFDIAGNSWNPLGAGVDGAVTHVVAMSISLDGGKSNDTVFAFIGEFIHCVAFSIHNAITADGFAIWVPSRGNWLQNLDVDAPFYYGRLSASLLDLPNGNHLYAGILASSSITAGGAALLSGQVLAPIIDIESLPLSVTFTDSTEVLRKHKVAAVITEFLDGVKTGAFYDIGGTSYTVLAGHFTARGSNNTTVHNLAVIETDGLGVINGLGAGLLENAIFETLGITGTMIFAGGNVNGNIGSVNAVGLITYDLTTNRPSTQPPALSPANSTVAAIAVHDKTGDVYVGGSFEYAGSLYSPGLCYYQTYLAQWNRPGNSLTGTVNSLMWTSDTILLAGGDLMINPTTGTPLASYDIITRTWSSYRSANELPGPVKLLALASSDGNQVWVSGQSSVGNSVYLMKYDGSSWLNATQQLGVGTVLSNLQMFTLTQSHDHSDLIAKNQALMLAGSIVIPGFGTASAALFNGTSLLPYLLTSGTDGSPGLISRIFSEKQNFFSSGGGDNLDLGLIILISLAVSLVIILLLVLAGIMLDRDRKRREGYVPAPTSIRDSGSGLRRIPPN